MTGKELYDLIVERFKALDGVEKLLEEELMIKARALTPEEAIGNVDRVDYPILQGNDIMIEAEIMGFKGQAFTDAPTDFKGTLNDILQMDFEQDSHARGLLIAAVNACMNYMGLSDNILHCRNEGPKLCGKHILGYMKEHYDGKKVLVVGYQPMITKNMAEGFKEVRVLDLNPDNIGENKSGIIIEDGALKMKDAVEWADMILCTGSTVCNATLTDYLETGKETMYFGTTLAGAATLLGLKRICYSDCVTKEQEQ